MEQLRFDWFDSTLGQEAAQVCGLIRVPRSDDAPETACDLPDQADIDGTRPVSSEPEPAPDDLEGNTVQRTLIELSESEAKRLNAELLSAIAELKEKKQDKWQRSVKRICNELARLEGIFARTFPYRPSEDLGRHLRAPHAAPLHDEFGEDSEP